MLLNQHAVRRHFRLTGGDDPLQVLVDGLLVEDPGTMTANSVPYLIAPYGDKALPYIEEAIKRADDPSKAIACLTPIQTEKSTEGLLRLFHSGQQKLRHPAMYALIHEPFRKGAKDAYFEILQERRYLPRMHRACVQFGWQDALPIFREIADKPDSIQEYRSAVHARRELEGNPISKALLDAERTMRSTMRSDRNAELDKQIAAARRLLIESDDSEAANLAALMLAVFTTKGGADPVRTAGIEILRARPRATTTAFLKSLAERHQGSGAAANPTAIENDRIGSVQDGTGPAWKHRLGTARGGESRLASLFKTQIVDECSEIDTDVVIPAPVTFKLIPDDALVIQ